MPMITEYGPWMDENKSPVDKADEVSFTGAPEVIIIIDTNYVKDVTLNAVSI